MNSKKIFIKFYLFATNRSFYISSDEIIGICQPTSNKTGTILCLKNPIYTGENRVNSSIVHVMEEYDRILKLLLKCEIDEVVTVF